MIRTCASDFRRRKMLGQHQFDQALVGHVAPVGLAFDGMQQGHGHAQGDGLRGELEIWHGDVQLGAADGEGDVQRASEGSARRFF